MIEGSDKVANLQGWLDAGPASLVEPSTSLFSYVVKSDTGFAPNPTEATCRLRAASRRIAAWPE